MCASQERLTVTVNVSSPWAAFSKFFHQMSYTCPKVPLQVNFFRWRHFEFPSMSLIFLRLRTLFMHIAQMTHTSLVQKYMYNTSVKFDQRVHNFNFLTCTEQNTCFGLRRDKSAAWDCSCASHITIYINLPLKELCHEMDMFSEGLMVFKIIEQLTVCDI
jgi:hypothetical protein